MEFEGIVFRKLPEQSGTSARGGWKKQDVVFELPGEFSRKICVTFFGDKVDEAARLNEGDVVGVSVNVESREYNGKWYTDVKAWRVTVGGSSGAGAQSATRGAGYAASAGTMGSGGYTASAAKEPSAMTGAPFDESRAPAADDADDLPF